MIQSQTHSYPIYIGEGIRYGINDLLQKSYSSVFVITDEHVAAIYLDDLVQSLDHPRIFTEIIPAGEASKNMEAYHQLQTKAIQNGLDRKSLILALGGGVVGDLAGFVAATFLRGIDYIQIPTTILAHDSSVGGKVAINHQLGKNLIGSFYSPQMVIYDVETLSTLPTKEWRSGYAEIMKEALIANPILFQELLETKLTKVQNEALIAHLKKGVQIKGHIVEQDEQENGILMYLNLGHTFGHALETLLGYGKLTHGEAVAIGLLFALHVSEKHLSSELPMDAFYNWMVQNDYPIMEVSLSVEQIIQTMKKDKKTSHQVIQMVLLEEVGKPLAVKIDDHHMRVYIESFLSLYSSLLR